MTPAITPELRERAGKALSIMHPWAWLIINGFKDIENRNWRCHRRGPVLIHAGKKVDRDAMKTLREGYHPVTGQPLDIDVYAVLPHTFETGGIVGEAVITGCVDRSDSPWFVGRYGIVMREARPLPFIPCKGALGFFVPALDAPPASPLATGEAASRKVLSGQKAFLSTLQGQSANGEATKHEPAKRFAEAVTPSSNPIPHSKRDGGGL